MKKYIGLAGAGGRELLQAVLLRREQPTVSAQTVADSEKEVERFKKVQQEYTEELETLYRETLNHTGEDAAKIFKAYRDIVNDNAFFNKSIRAVREKHLAIDYAIDREKQAVCSKFSTMPDPYLKERGDDIRNVCDEIIRRLNGIETVQEQIRGIDKPFILVAETLTPEDTVKIDKTFLRGFVTEQGGVTSHVVILAKTLGIPAVVGTAGIVAGIRQGQALYINGDEGYAISEPDEAFIEKFQREKAELEQKKKLYAAKESQPAFTADGRRVSVCINSGDKESRKNFKAEACDGIGLFRTEFLFMNQRDYPDEETQYQVYREVAERAQGKEVIIRTLDIGGDKQLDYMGLPKENNPFLGYRAIRICLDRKEIFLTQLRAILRASAFGKIKIMFPMIVTLEELRAAKQAVQEAKEQLRMSQVAFQEDIPTGIMIETPASVLISDQLAKEADFFSIGTNDLIQYVTATDRMNEKVQYLYDSCNLSVLRAIAHVIENAHREGIPVGMCGEAASDGRLTPLLVAMGLDEFSVVPSQVGRIKYLIHRYNAEQLSPWAKGVLNSDSIMKVKEKLAEQTAE